MHSACKWQARAIAHCTVSGENCRTCAGCMLASCMRQQTTHRCRARGSTSRSAALIATPQSERTTMLCASMQPCRLHCCCTVTSCCCTITVPPMPVVQRMSALYGSALSPGAMPQASGWMRPAGVRKVNARSCVWRTKAVGAACDASRRCTMCERRTDRSSVSGQHMYAKPHTWMQRQLVKLKACASPVLCSGI